MNVTQGLRRRRIETGLAAALGSALFLLFGAGASAQDADNYPNRPVMMIVPFAPGGASDFVARSLQPGVSQILGQQIVVDNRLGAAGIVGTDRLRRLAQLKVRYGPAIPLDDIRDDPEAPRLATDRLMNAIHELEASL